MSSITVLLKTHRQKKDGSYPVVVRVHAAGRTYYEYVGVSVKEKQFRDQHGKWIKDHPDAGFFNNKIEEIRTRVLAQLNEEAGYIRTPKPAKALTSLSNYLTLRAAQFKAAGKIDMDRKLRRTKDELEEIAGRPVYFQEIDMNWIRNYIAWCLKAGNCHNTAMRKIKNLRTIYRQAVIDKQASLPNPFSEYKIHLEPVNREKLTREEILAIEKVHTVPGSVVFHAKNAFLFALYAQGMRFENLFLLKKSAIRGNILLYQMNKGKKYREIDLHPKAREIADWYFANNPGEFVFPFCRKEPKGQEELINAKGSANALVNAALKNIAGIANISKPLSMHIARHSFAHLLKKSAIDMHIIKDALGHSDMRTTETYLADLDDDVINREVNRVLG